MEEDGGSPNASELRVLTLNILFLHSTPSQLHFDDNHLFFYVPHYPRTVIAYYETRCATAPPPWILPRSCRRRSPRPRAPRNPPAKRPTKARHNQRRNTCAEEMSKPRV